MRVFAVASLLFFSCITSDAQSKLAIPDYPEIGKPCPDFALKNVKYFSKTNVSLKDLRGKRVILDFFTSNCSACFASLPHVNAQAKKGGDKLVYMMVGSPDNKIGPLYESYRKKMNLVMPAAFDRNLFDKWGVSAVPRLFVIDERGIVRAITSGLSDKQFDAFMAGEGLTPLKTTSDRDTGVPMLYGSSISRFDPARQKTDWRPPVIFRDSQNVLKLEITNISLPMLINYAYWGDYTIDMGDDSAKNYYAAEPKALCRDSALFHYSYRNQQNLFNYTLRLPAASYSTSDARRVMRQDLCLYFGWDISLENTNQPCLALQVSDSLRAMLPARNGEAKSELNSSHFDFDFHSAPFDQFLRILIHAFPWTGKPILDQTGITGNIDFQGNSNGPWTNLEQLQDGLQNMGFRLVPVEQQMKTLVVRDRKGNTITPSEDQYRGIEFENGLSWEQALAKAKAENKKVFVYAYPGKSYTPLIDSLLFSKEIIGDFFKEKFVSLRYSIDGELSEDAKRIATLCGNATYPLVLFFSADGRPLHVSHVWSSCPLISFAAASVNPDLQYYTLLHQFQEGKLQKQDRVKTIFDMAVNLSQPVALQIGHDYLNRFVKPGHPNAHWNMDAVSVIMALRAAGDTGASRLFYQYRKEIGQVKKDSVFVEKEMAMSVIYPLESEAAKKQSLPDWTKIKTEIEKVVPGFDYSLLLLSQQVSFYQSKKDWDQYGSYAIKYLEEPRLKKDANKINEIVWNIFLHCSDAELLKKTIPWGKKAVELSNDNVSILDTYAQLLYKADKLHHIKTGEDYMEMESRVAGMLHQEDIYSKMQQGLPTWEK